MAEITRLDEIRRRNERLEALERVLVRARMVFILAAAGTARSSQWMKALGELKEAVEDVDRLPPTKRPIK